MYNDKAYIRMFEGDFLMKKKLTLVLAAALFVFGLSSCSVPSAKVPKLDPKAPLTLEVWHYYNGPQKTAFDTMVTEFNDTVGLEMGIVIEAFSQGKVEALNQKILDSANQAVGSEALPDIFATYADMAFHVNKLGLLTNLDNYFTEDELSAYRAEFIAEGRFSAEKTLCIFPIAKSLELMMINLTDWNVFAASTGAELTDLGTIEGVTAVSEAYYQWTDSLTAIPDDGKAFFGRDAMANYMIIGCRQLGTTLFEVHDDGTVTVNIDKEILRKLWDNSYVPYINGWFSANGRFRSDEAKLGDIIALVGSSSAVSYFPTKISISDFQEYPIESLILPAPQFADSQHYAVQQGAGLAVTKSDPEHEYASAVFLKWFTDVQRNAEFAVASCGYLPVKNDALNLDAIKTALADGNSDAMEQTFTSALDVLSNNTLYTVPPFEGNIESRAVLDTSINAQAASDRAAILALMQQGISHADAVAQYDTDENFNAWLAQITVDLETSMATLTS